MEPQPAIDQAAAELQEKLAPETKTDLDKLLDKDLTWRAPTPREIAQDAASLFTLADALWAGGVAGKDVTKEQARAKVLAGAEYGWTPMYALNNLSVSKDGRLGMSAIAMRALFLQRVPRAKLVIEATAECATIKAWRPGQDWCVVTWTQEDSDRALLTDFAKSYKGDEYKTTHGKYSEDMKVARATTRIARRYWPDIMGPISYTVEELDDEIAPPAPVPEADPAAPTLPTRREQEGGKEAPRAAEPPEAAPKPPTVSEALKKAQAAIGARWREMKQELDPAFKWDGALFGEFCASITGRPMPPAAWTMDDVAAINKDIDEHQNPQPRGQRGEPETTEGQEIDA